MAYHEIRKRRDKAITLKKEGGGGEEEWRGRNPAPVLMERHIIIVLPLEYGALGGAG